MKRCIIKGTNPALPPLYWLYRFKEDEVKSVTWTINLSDKAKYRTDLEADWNKLLGISFGKSIWKSFTTKHEGTVMIGWRYIDSWTSDKFNKPEWKNTFQLTGYYHKDYSGTVIKEQSIFILPQELEGKDLKLTMISGFNKGFFILHATGVGEQPLWEDSFSEFVKPKKWGRTINPWFGGDTKPSNTIYFKA